MESPHPDERPPKKRRFFEEASDDAPVHLSPAHRPASASPVSVPSPAKTSFDSAPSLPDTHVTNNGRQDGETLPIWDADMLQAVVGELPDATLRKLKDMSSGDVQRGRNARVNPNKEASTDHPQPSTSISTVLGTLRRLEHPQSSLSRNSKPSPAPSDNMIPNSPPPPPPTLAPLHQLHPYSNRCPPSATWAPLA